jgi:hypothetical protein
MKNIFFNFLISNVLYLYINLNNYDKLEKFRNEFFYYKSDKK